MRRVLFVVTLAVLLLAGGCGVMMNAEYSQILDRTVVLSAETAKRADAGTITPEEMKAALTLQAMTWKHFQDARDGKVTESAH